MIDHLQSNDALAIQSCDQIEGTMPGRKRSEHDRFKMNAAESMSYPKKSYDY